MTSKIKLPDVTLFGCDANDPKGLLRAAEICQMGIEFGAVKIFTEHNFYIGRKGYSDWIIQGLNEHIETSHTIIFHNDGIIQDPTAWRDEWLEYDYIGAPWNWKKKYVVGNGGACLRSKKLLKVLASLDLNGIDTFPEDQFICEKIRDWLEREYDIKFAPIEVAKEFSIEGYGIAPNLNIYQGEFMSHGFGVRGLPYPPLALQQHRVNGFNKKLIRK